MREFKELWFCLSLHGSLPKASGFYDWSGFPIRVHLPAGCSFALQMSSPIVITQHVFAAHCQSLLSQDGLGVISCLRQGNWLINWIKYPLENIPQVAMAVSVASENRQTGPCDLKILKERSSERCGESHGIKFRGFRGRLSWERKRECCREFPNERRLWKHLCKKITTEGRWGKKDLGILPGTFKPAISGRFKKDCLFSHVRMLEAERFGGRKVASILK